MDYAASENGGVVVLTTSEDERQPGENVTSGGDDSFWMSTGCFPQEVVIQLPQPQRLSRIKVTGTCLRKLRAEGCAAETPSNFAVLAEADMELTRQPIQTRELNVQSADPVRFVK